MEELKAPPCYFTPDELLAFRNDFDHVLDEMMKESLNARKAYLYYTHRKHEYEENPSAITEVAAYDASQQYARALETLEESAATTAKILGSININRQRGY